MAVSANEKTKNFFFWFFKKSGKSFLKKWKVKKKSGIPPKSGRLTSLREGKRETDRERKVVCWLLEVLATYYCILGMGEERPEANWHRGLCTLRLQRNKTDGPPHPPELSRLAATETPVMVAGWANHHQAVGNGWRPPPHHPVPGNMWTEGLSTADGPQQKKKKKKTCAAPPNSWQRVDWGSKHGWSTAEEEEEEDLCRTTQFLATCGLRV